MKIYFFLILFFADFVLHTETRNTMMAAENLSKEKVVGNKTSEIRHSDTGTQKSWSSKKPSQEIVCTALHLSPLLPN